MKSRRPLHIVLAVLAIVSAAVLFVTYGKTLPMGPFDTVRLEQPTVVDSDGEYTAVVVSESRRALVLNSSGDLTGIINCETLDSPIDAITDVCISNGLVYASGIVFEPDSDLIQFERVIAYNVNGSIKGIVHEEPSVNFATTAIRSLGNASDGIVFAYEKINYVSYGDPENDSSTKSGDSTLEIANTVLFEHAGEDGVYEVSRISDASSTLLDIAVTQSDQIRYVILGDRGRLSDGVSDFPPSLYDGHVFTAIDIDDDGTLYVCDDLTGSLYSIAPGSTEACPLVAGDGFDDVHVNADVLSLCDSNFDKVILCDKNGTILREFSEVKLSEPFSAQMVLVWASRLYLLILALVLAIRKVRRMVREGGTEGVGSMLMTVAVVSSIAVAIGSLSFASYQSSLATRANEINAAADYLYTIVDDLSESMEKLNDRTSFRGADDEYNQALDNVANAAYPALDLVFSNQNNGIGLYCAVYGKDDSGIFYLVGSDSEIIMGSSPRTMNIDLLNEAFKIDSDLGHKLQKGRSLRDLTQYRLIQIPTSDGKAVAGVIEIGSKMKSFESSLISDQMQHILGLLVMMLVVYLGYSEIRNCGRCLYSYRAQLKDNAYGAISLLTRPFTLVVTMTMSIDSVMMVLITRDLLVGSGIGDTSPLIGLPAVLFGIGLIVGQGLYGYLGSRIELRRLMARGALAMFAFSALAGATVLSGNFWLYCVAKLIMSIPFGMLYALGYSLPRLADNEEARAQALGDLRRTDTSAVALGTVLGGYAATALGNVWVYVLMTVACIPVIFLALNLLPKDGAPLEEMAQTDKSERHIREFAKTPIALGLALLVVLPAAIAAGYASFLFPLFSANLGLSDSDISNIVVLGYLIVYVCINSIDSIVVRYGERKTATVSIALLGLVFLLFSVNTTLVWSMAVIALVAVFCKSSEAWKITWFRAACEAGVPAGKATSSMLATRRLALVAQPFVLSLLLGLSENVAVIVIGFFCALCAAAFFLVAIKSKLADDESEGESASPENSEEL